VFTRARKAENGELGITVSLLAEWEGAPFCFTVIRLSSRLLDRDLSATVYNVTRKVVIYAQLQRSPGKLGWKLVVILTCKSFV